MVNIDQLNHFDLVRAVRSAFALVDKLQEREQDTQLPGAMLFAYAFIATTGIKPCQLCAIAERVRQDAKLRQQPEVEAMIRYFFDELVDR